MPRGDKVRVAQHPRIGTDRLAGEDRVLMPVSRPVGEGIGVEDVRLGELGQHADRPVRAVPTQFTGSDVLGTDQAR
jgi:hypothetical protein